MEISAHNPTLCFALDPENISLKQERNQTTSHQYPVIVYPKLLSFSFRLFYNENFKGIKASDCKEYLGKKFRVLSFNHRSEEYENEAAITDFFLERARFHVFSPKQVRVSFKDDYYFDAKQSFTENGKTFSFFLENAVIVSDLMVLSRHYWSKIFSQFDIDCMHRINEVLKQRVLWFNHLVSAKEKEKEATSKSRLCFILHEENVAINEQTPPSKLISFKEQVEIAPAEPIRILEGPFELALKKKLLVDYIFSHLASLEIHQNQVEGCYARVGYAYNHILNDEDPLSIEVGIHLNGPVNLSGIFAIMQMAKLHITEGKEIQNLKITQNVHEFVKNDIVLFKFCLNFHLENQSSRRHSLSQFQLEGRPLVSDILITSKESVRLLQNHLIVKAAGDPHLEALTHLFKKSFWFQHYLAGISHN